MNGPPPRRGPFCYPHITWVRGSVAVRIRGGRGTMAYMVRTMNERLVRVGLTGGIAAGKSTVAARMRALGVPVIDYDELARVWWPPAARA